MIKYSGLDENYILTYSPKLTQRVKACSKFPYLNIYGTKKLMKRQWSLWTNSLERYETISGDI